MINYESLDKVLIAHKDNQSRGITVITGEAELKFVPYGMIYNRALKVLHCLQKKGIKQGETLILLTEDIEAFIYIFWACILGGIIPVPITAGNNDSHRMKIFKICEILDTPYLITDEKFAKTLKTNSSSNYLVDSMEKVKDNLLLLNEVLNGDVQAIPNKIYGENIAFIQFSSGSTGEPKGVVLTHTNLVTNVKDSINAGGFKQSDSMLSWMPLTHDMGLIGFHILPLYFNINQFLIPTSLFIRRPTLWIKSASDNKCTVLSSPNFGYKYFLSFYKRDIEYGWDLSNVRLIFNGAEPISSKLCYEFLEEIGKYGLKKTTIYTVYGMAEACVAVAFPQHGEEISCVNIDRTRLNIGQKVVDVDATDKNVVNFVIEGFPVGNSLLKICDENGALLDDGTIGLIHIKGDNVTSGYYRNDKATKNIISNDGWLNTGDIGFISNKGLVVTGRAKDIIFVNGLNYYPHDIEGIVEGIEKIQLGEVGVCGVFNEGTQKEDIVVFIITKKNIEEFVDLVIRVKRRIHIYFGLDVKDVIPVRKFPKTTSGKIQRYKLAENYKNGIYDDVILRLNQLLETSRQSNYYRKPDNEIEAKLLEIWKDVLQYDDIGIDCNFFEIGGNSTLLVKMINKVNDVYPGKIKITDAFDCSTISKIERLIKTQTETENDSNLLLPKLRFPKDFFELGECCESDRLSFQTGFYEFTLQGNVYNKIKIVSQKEGVDFHDFILFCFIVLLSKVVDDDILTVSTVMNPEDIKAVKIKMRDFNDFSILIRNISQQRKESSRENYINLSETLNFTNSDYDLSVAFFYCKDTDLKVEIERLCDIGVAFYEENEFALIKCYYSIKKINMEKADKLFMAFEGIISRITDEYKL